MRAQATTWAEAPRGAAEPPASRPLNLLVFNEAMDLNHTALGFKGAWVNALAEQCEHVSVITMTAGEIDVAPNVTVRSLGKERGWSEPRRLVEFYRLVNRAIAEHDVDACFIHMAPLFAALIAPVARRHRIPVLLWHAHGAVSARLRLGHALADRCVTATPASFSLPSDKLQVIGHGIDVDLFRPPQSTPARYESTLLSIGRIAPTKKVDEMVSALARLRERGRDVRLELTGSALTPDDERYEAEVRRQVEDLGLGDAVSFCGKAGFGEVAARYHHGSVFLNLSETRSMDKAILESMASGCIPVSRNESFLSLAAEHGLERLVPGPGADGVAEAVEIALALEPGERAALSERLRDIVVREHRLEVLIDRILDQLRELVAERR
jgi:glycosyltransferase involved in cell wall biosynthesis